MWGQVVLPSFVVYSDRIIPMRVGTRCASKRLTSRHRDHPHACGDKFSLNRFKREVKGSSPCVWGQVEHKKDTISFDRIIPMRVGTSTKSSLTFSPSKDHPHACGDKQYLPSACSNPPGSSPCVWGQDKKICFYRHNTRIIPMRVGTSTPRPCECGS